MPRARYDELVRQRGPIFVVPDVRAFEMELYQFIESRRPEVFRGIAEKKQLDDDLKARLKSAIEGGRFSSSEMGISTTRLPSRPARSTSSLAKTSRSTTQRAATGAIRSREKAFTPWVSVPRKPSTTFRVELWTQVATRR